MQSGLIMGLNGEHQKEVQARLEILKPSSGERLIDLFGYWLFDKRCWLFITRLSESRSSFGTNTSLFSIVCIQLHKICHSGYDYVFCN